MTNLAEFTSVLGCWAGPGTDLESVKEARVHVTFVNSSRSIQIESDTIFWMDISKPQRCLGTGKSSGKIFHWTGGNLKQDRVNLEEPPAGGQFKDKLFKLTHWSYCELLFHKYHINPDNLSALLHSLAIQFPHSESSWGHRPLIRSYRQQTDFFCLQLFAFYSQLTCKVQLHCQLFDWRL